MQQKLGKWSLRFTEAPFILESSSVVGTKEADGPLGGLFDIVGKDDRFGQNTWEKAESSMQRDALLIATGGTMQAAAELVEELGGEVVKMLFLIELAGLNGRKLLSKYDVDAVVSYDGK